MGRESSLISVYVQAFCVRHPEERMNEQELIHQSIGRGKQIAAPCGPEQMKRLEVRAMDQYLSFWNLMVSPSLPFLSFSVAFQLIDSLMDGVYV